MTRKGKMMEQEEKVTEQKVSRFNGNGALGGEIRSMRRLMKRVMDKIEENKDANLDDMLRVLDLHSRASTRLATLLKAERTLDASELNAEFDRALDDVLREMEMEAAK
jgi:hypothetical protein